MSFRTEYVQISEDIIQLLTDNIADVNYKLAYPFDIANPYIIKNNPFSYPGGALNYPIICVFPDSKIEDFKNLGARGAKELNLFFSIICGTQISSTTPIEDDIECWQLAANIEYIFRNNIQFSQNIEISNPLKTDFKIALKDSVFITLVKIDLSLNLRIKGV